MKKCLKFYSTNSSDFIIFDNGFKLWWYFFWIHDYMINNVFPYFLKNSASKLYFSKWNDENDEISEITLKNEYNQKNTYSAFFKFLMKFFLPHWNFFVRQSTLYSEWKELLKNADKKFPKYMNIAEFVCYDERESEFKANWNIVLNKKINTDIFFMNKCDEYETAIAKLKTSKLLSFKNN